jgi:uroporphyrin-III C-methyltransferase / precorrin-2 dehydrogenase / sirohydrochlorin ferrochelatase
VHWRIGSWPHAIRARWPDASERRRAVDAALVEGGPLDSLSGRTDVEGWLAGDAASGAHARLTLLFASPDPDDLTLRHARLLASADRIYHGPDVPDAILNRARADAVRICGCAPPAPEPGLTIVARMA